MSRKWTRISICQNLTNDWRMRRQLVPGPVVHLTVIKAKTRSGIEASLAHSQKYMYITLYKSTLKRNNFLRQYMAVVNCLSIWRDHKPMQRSNLQSTDYWIYEERRDCHQNLSEYLKKKVIYLLVSTHACMPNSLHVARFTVYTRHVCNVLDLFLTWYLPYWFL